MGIHLRLASLLLLATVFSQTTAGGSGPARLFGRANLSFDEE
jgi:hypothetical protein